MPVTLALVAGYTKKKYSTCKKVLTTYAVRAEQDQRYSLHGRVEKEVRPWRKAPWRNRATCVRAWSTRWFEATDSHLLVAFHFIVNPASSVMTLASVNESRHQAAVSRNGRRFNI